MSSELIGCIHVIDTSVDATLARGASFLVSPLIHR